MEATVLWVTLTSIMYVTFRSESITQGTINYLAISAGQSGGTFWRSKCHISMKWSFPAGRLTAVISD